MTHNTLQNEYHQYLMPTYSPQPIALERGEGCYVYDTEGKRYLDFISGVAVNALGYNHPKLTAALCDQSHKLIHTSNLFIIKEQVELARKLTGKFGGGKAFFGNSGAEAIEGAIKLARKYAKKNLGPDKYEIITMKKSFHGRTLAAITATGQEKYQKDLDPLVPGFRYAQFGDIGSIRACVNQNTCAVLIEPVQGEGGVNFASQEFWNALAELCRNNGLLLILDEIQTGVGRTGTFFAHEHYNLNPDIVTLAKGLGGGVPIGALLARDNIAASWAPGDHASTFGGNPLACRAANAVVQTIDEENLLGHVREMEHVIAQATAHYASHFQIVTAVRGKGLMWGIECVPEHRGADMVAAAREKGLLLNCIGGHIIRIAPPLIIAGQELKDGFALLETLLSAYNYAK